MAESFRPRENDHIVEPMYEALRPGTEGEAEPPPEPSPRTAGWRSTVLVLIVVGALALVVWRLSR